MQVVDGLAVPEARAARRVAAPDVRPTATSTGIELSMPRLRDRAIRAGYSPMETRGLNQRARLGSTMPAIAWGLRIRRGRPNAPDRARP